MSDKLSVFFFAGQDHFEYFYEGESRKAAILLYPEIFSTENRTPGTFFPPWLCRRLLNHRIRFYKEFKYQQVK